MGKILTKNDKEIIDFFNRIQDLKKILKSLKTDQLRSLQNEQYITCLLYTSPSPRDA